MNAAYSPVAYPGNRAWRHSLSDLLREWSATPEFGHLAADQMQSCIVAHGRPRQEVNASGLYRRSVIEALARDFQTAWTDTGFGVGLAYDKRYETGTLVERLGVRCRACGWVEKHDRYDQLGVRDRAKNAVDLRRLLIGLELRSLEFSCLVPALCAPCRKAADIYVVKRPHVSRDVALTAWVAAQLGRAASQLKKRAA